MQTTAGPARFLIIRYLCLSLCADYFDTHRPMFEYNTSRKKLIFPEYGRNIQEMVDHIQTIADREERNRAAKSIIDVMGTIQPHLRDANDFKHKLWDHLAIMSNFQLDIDYPYELPTLETLSEKPHSVPYPTMSVANRHYGSIILAMIRVACDMEEGEMRNHLVELIAINMKKSYLSWNREGVEDEIIIKDLERLSNGALKVQEIARYTESRVHPPQRSQGGTNKKRRPFHSNFKSNSGRNFNGNGKKQ